MLLTSPLPLSARQTGAINDADAHQNFNWLVRDLGYGNVCILQQTTTNPDGAKALAYSFSQRRGQFPSSGKGILNYDGCLYLIQFEKDVSRRPVKLLAEFNFAFCLQTKFFFVIVDNQTSVSKTKTSSKQCEHV